MKYNEKVREACGIKVQLVTEATMVPRMRVIIDGTETFFSLKSKTLLDLKSNSTSYESIIDTIIDDEIEKHPNFKKVIRRKKLENIENNK